MPRWLKWAIVTLPLAACLFLWIQSYWFSDSFQWEGPNRVIVLRFNEGALVLTISVSKPPQGSVSTNQSWWHTRKPATGGHDVKRRVLGFGLERADFLANFNFILAELPMWAPTLLCAIPLLWLYRRQRKRRKQGFAVEPIAANSKESAPAQTDSPAATHREGF
jgi:hypothetical protein